MSLACTQILVALKNADPTAITAQTCLQRSLGYGDELRAVRRRILWELVGPEEEPIDPLLETLRRGGELWNPNKENARLRRYGQGAESLIATPRATEEILTLAWDPERDLDRRPAAMRAARLRGWRLARGTVWGLSWRCEDSVERERLSEEAVLCRGPRHGLLVHPHLENHRRVDLREKPPWLPAPE